MKLPTIMVLVASLVMAATLSVVPVSVDALTTVKKEISNPSGQLSVGTTSATESEVAAASIESESTLGVRQATSGDGPAYTSTRTHELPGDRTIEGTTETPDDSDVSAANHSSEWVGGLHGPGCPNRPPQVC